MTAIRDTGTLSRRPALLFALAIASLSLTGAERRYVPVSHNTAVTITVNAAQNRHPIDPRIYGVAFAKPGTFDGPDALGFTVNRWGGNATSRHNWLYNTTNRAKDYFFENIPDTVTAGTELEPGAAGDQFIAPTLDAGVDAIMTIPMMGMLPFDRSIRCGYSVADDGASGCCRNTDFFRPDCGDGRHVTEYDPKIFNYRRLKGINDVSRTTIAYPSSLQGQWVQHMVDTHKVGAHPNGVRYYALDNEPSLWSFDHWDVHPDGATTDEVRDKMFDYGATIKSTDPAALTTGPEEWGWDGYFYSGLDQENYATPEFGDDQAAHGGIPYTRYLLQQARDYEQTNGTRILDFFTLHFYPQSGEFCCPFDNVDAAMQALRNRSTRALWDPNYKDESYIGDTGLDGGKVRLIPRLREWANNDYPGTKIGITEYNWGAENHINGATAQADILGIFGREGLDLGVRWTAPNDNGSPVYNAIRMYRNYDGAMNAFGDMSVAAGTNVEINADDVATFAAIRTSDSNLTVMIIAKTLGTDYDATVNLANFNASGPAEVWQLAAGTGITRMADANFVASSASLTVPAQSITLLVIPGQYQDTPSGLVATWNPASSRVDVQWNPVVGVGGPATYDVFRKSAGGGFVSLGTASTCPGNPTTFCDSSVTSPASYLYEVRAIGAGIQSGFSNVDVATTVTFTDDPPVNIKSVHVTELQVAVNTMRNLVPGLGTQTFQTVTPGTVVNAEHIRELRRGVNQARAWLGLPPMTYVDPAITPRTSRIKAQHILDLRNSVK
ncbi:MAG: glycoside hydrolase family 44 protein [Thermoanaerobaculia bacterium]